MTAPNDLRAAVAELADLVRNVCDYNKLDAHRDWAILIAARLRDNKAPAAPATDEDWETVSAPEVLVAADKDWETVRASMMGSGAVVGRARFALQRLRDSYERVRAERDRLATRLRAAGAEATQQDAERKNGVATGGTEAAGSFREAPTPPVAPSAPAPAVPVCIQTATSGGVGKAFASDLRFAPAPDVAPEPRRRWLNYYGDHGCVHENEAVADAYANKEHPSFKRLVVVEASAYDALADKLAAAEKARDHFREQYQTCARELEYIGRLVEREDGYSDSVSVGLSVCGVLGSQQVREFGLAETIAELRAQLAALSRPKTREEVGKALEAYVVSFAKWEETTTQAMAAALRAIGVSVEEGV